MKIIGKTVIPISLAFILSACNGVTVTPAMTSQINIIGTAASIAKTEVVMTLTAVPTTTVPPPTPIPPTPIPPTLTSIPPEAYADKIDYAMSTAPKVYKLYPFINEASYYSGEYSGCVKTNDFQNFVAYGVSLPLEVVNTAFENYFKSEKWEFTEADSENNVPRTTYDVYRISTKDTPAFERLGVVLTDESARRGKNYIDVRIALTHVETKENLRYLLYPLTCYDNNESWLWIRLYK